MFTLRCGSSCPCRRGERALFPRGIRLKQRCLWRTSSPFLGGCRLDRSERRSSTLKLRYFGVDFSQQRLCIHGDTLPCNRGLLESVFLVSTAMPIDYMTTASTPTESRVKFSGSGQTHTIHSRLADGSQGWCAVPIPHGHVRRIS